MSARQLELVRANLAEILEGRTVVQIWPACYDDPERDRQLPTPVVAGWKAGDGFGEIRLLDGQPVTVPDGFMIKWNPDSWHPVSEHDKPIGARRIGQIVRTI